ncbi:hypothetical protein HOG21_02685 [bacterium]|nr:hypothetical protein [bacterium]
MCGLKTQGKLILALIAFTNLPFLNTFLFQFSTFVATIFRLIGRSSIFISKNNVSKYFNTLFHFNSHSLKSKSINFK